MRVICQILLEKGCQVACGFPDTHWIDRQTKSYQLKGQFSSFGLKFPKRDVFVDRILTRVFDRAPLRSSITLWNQATRAIKTIESTKFKKIDGVFFPMIDDYLRLKTLNRVSFPYPWAGLSIFPTWLKPDQPDSLTLEQSSCKGLFFLDETTVETAKQFLKIPCFAFPDFAEEGKSKSNALGSFRRLVESSGKGKCKIGLFGVLDRRKGLFELIQIAKRLPSDSYQFFIFGEPFGLMGKMDVWHLSRHIKTTDNVHLIAEKIPSDTEFNQLIQQMDLLWLGYRNFPYSSNQMTRAAMMKTPVIVAEGGLLEKRIDRFGHGFSIPIEDSQCSSNKISRYFDSTKLNPDAFSKYLAEHSIDRLRQTLDAFLQLLD